MKILLGMPDKNSWGGPNACEPPFAVALRETGTQVDEETYVYGDKKKGTALLQRFVRVTTTAWRMRRTVRRNEYNLIHLNTAFDTKALLRDAFTLFLLPPRAAKIFLKMHGSDNFLLQTDNFLKKKLWHFVTRRADGIGVLSSEEKNNFARAGVPATKIFVVKNAVQPVADTAPAAMQKSGNRLLFVARFIPTKGLLDSLHACAILQKNGVEFSLTCVGDGPARTAAETLTAELNLTERVTFTGYVSEEKVSDYFRQSDILVFPTFHAEGFPMVIFNALAAGLPVITTRIRAAADYLQEPPNCLWVAAQNPAQLAEKIEFLLSHKTLQAQMSANNKNLARQFTAAQIAQEYLAIYRNLLDQKSPQMNADGRR